MPDYIIYSRIKKAKEWAAEGTIHARSIRSAWSGFRKNYKDQIDIKKEYFIYPINHSRFWTFKGGKWKLNSFLGNHNRKAWQKKQQKLMQEYFDRRNPQSI